MSADPSGVAGMPRLLLRLEGAALLIVSGVIYGWTGNGWSGKVLPPLPSSACDVDCLALVRKFRPSRHIRLSIDAVDEWGRIICPLLARQRRGADIVLRARRGRDRILI